MDVLGRKRMLFSMPDKVAELLAAVTQFLPTPPITKDQLILLKHDNVVQGEAFPKIFGEPSAVEDVLPTYICGRWTDPVNTTVREVFEFDLNWGCFCSLSYRLSAIGPVVVEAIWQA